GSAVVIAARASVALAAATTRIFRHRHAAEPLDADLFRNRHLHALADGRRHALGGGDRDLHADGVGDLLANLVRNLLANRDVHHAAHLVGHLLDMVFLDHDAGLHGHKLLDGNRNHAADGVRNLLDAVFGYRAVDGVRNPLDHVLTNVADGRVASSGLD